MSGAVFKSASSATTGAAFDCADLIALFDHQFEASERTVLCGGAQEPEFIPACSGARSADQPQDLNEGLSKILFTHDYFASALHEVSHWCLAGAKRRKQPDYGYWYKPVRDSSDQLAFEAVEARPQALEWVFSRAAGFPFQASVDNLNFSEYDRGRFNQQIFVQVEAFCEQGLPARAEQFFLALAAHYQMPATLRRADFNVQALQAPSESKT